MSCVSKSGLLFTVKERTKAQNTKDLCQFSEAVCGIPAASKGVKNHKSHRPGNINILKTCEETGVSGHKAAGERHAAGGNWEYESN